MTVEILKMEWILAMTAFFALGLFPESMTDKFSVPHSPKLLIFRALAMALRL